MILDFNLDIYSFLLLLKHECNELLLEYIEKGGNINTKDSEGRTLLMKLIQASEYRTSVYKYINLILAREDLDIDAQDNWGYTGLMYAIQHYNSDALEQLLKRGANVNIQNKDGATVLMLAIVRYCGTCNKLVYSLLDKSDISIQDNDGYTVLLISLIERVEMNFIKKILAKDVNIVNIPTKKHVLHKELRAPYFTKGSTPLMVAAGKGMELAVYLLLRAGADPSIKNREGKTALFYVTNFVCDDKKEDIRDMLVLGIENFAKKYSIE